MNKENKKLLQKLRKSVKPFEINNRKKSAIQIVNTLPPLFIFVILSIIVFQIYWPLTIFISTISSCFLVRTFIIFHDCCHGSFLKKQKYNTFLGNITGFLTFFPFRKWRREHLLHHAGSGNLEKRGIGDIWVMTVEEYQKAPSFERVKYRIYRNPFVMFFLGPIFLVFISNRLNSKNIKPKERYNTWLNNLCLILVYGALLYLLGPIIFISVFGPMVFIAGVIGIWLFYIQHTFEDSYFEDASKWDFVKASIEGSSFYRLPKLLQWITGNIGYHHVHHLNPRIPNYQLEKTHKTVVPLHHATTITLWQSFSSLKYKLYDERNKHFITFKDFNKRYNPF
ncbi:fatty acid desaturase [Staphylococcus succinus]|uniref:fatty acid desaturase n=1 Tax=Staphylococcus succinus TaxID=61015 RepID=UPI001C0408AF|nr:fatty acid desaturase [Staphylococcus succinus]MBU0437735.1 fatty acid desaturase [Staphylococcus succinus]